MRLHENEEDFRDLCSITAGYIGIPQISPQCCKRNGLLIHFLPVFVDQFDRILTM